MLGLLFLVLFPNLAFYYLFTTNTATFFNSLERLEQGKKEENLFSFEAFTALRWSDFF